MKITKLFNKNKTGMLPTFLIIGAQKAGTSSLHDYLSDHPQLFLSQPKELHFFDLYYAKGLDWYKSHFIKSSPDQVQFGESTPYYLFHPRVPQLVKKHIPNIKLIVLLRDPVDRAYSHFKMICQNGDENETSFKKALALEKERLAGEEEKLSTNSNYQSFNHQMYSYTARGFYADQIKRWLSHFPGNQFLFLKSENLAVDPEKCLKEVHQFLQVDYHTPVQFFTSNQGNYDALSAQEKDALKPLFSRDQAELAKLLGDDF